MMDYRMSNVFAALRRSLRPWLLGLALVAAVIATAPRVHAASSDDEEVHPDARLEGYKEPVILKEGGVAGTVLFMLVLMGITFGVMFINAKRSHLD
jgi:hypothetical protein